MALVYNNTIGVNTDNLITKKYTISHILIFKIKYNINKFHIIRHQCTSYFITDTSDSDGGIWNMMSLMVESATKVTIIRYWKEHLFEFLKEMLLVLDKICVYL